MMMVRASLFWLCVSYLPFANFYSIVSSQAIICDDSCPCMCKNATFASNQGDEELPSLNCSGVGVNSVSVCGSLTKFRHIDFSDNEIVSFPAGIKLCEERHASGNCLIDLSHNKIENFYLSYTEDNGSPVSKILIDLSYNRLSTPGRLIEFALPWQNQTITVNVSHNFISYITENFITFPQTSSRKTVRRELVIVLDLSYNNIAFYHPLSLSLNIYSPESIRRLRLNVTLLLHHNRITSFQTSSYLRNLTRPYRGYRPNFFTHLGDNQITGINQADLVYTSGLRMNLQGNPWNCDCQNRWIANNSSLLRQVLSRRKSVQPFCKTPSSVEQRPLLSLSQDDFICPPQEDTSIPRSFHVSEGDTVELLCPVTTGEPPFETIKWSIPRGIGVHQSFLLLETSANSSLVIRNMNHDWQGSYICTVDNGVEVSFVLNVSLAEDGLTAAPGAGSGVPFVLDPPRAKVNSLTGTVIVLSLLLVIATFVIVAVCIVHCRSQQSKSENRDDVVRSEFTENRFLEFPENISNKYTVQQQKSENHHSSTTENTRENLSDSNEIFYENAHHSGRKRRDVTTKTGSKVVSVKYDEDMSVYYNVSPTPSPTTDKSKEYVAKIDDTEYTDLDIHEITKPTSETYQCITPQSGGDGSPN